MCEKYVARNKSKQIDKHGISFEVIKSNVVHQISIVLFKRSKRRSKLKINNHSAIDRREKSFWRTKIKHIFS